MIAAGVFDLPSQLLAWFYALTHDYAASIALIAVVVMVITAPLTLKSTKGMLEMQRLAPEMRKLQAQYRNDRTKLNEEMMKLYQEHKVNPLSSCLPLLAQMPIFIIMFRILYGLTFRPSGGSGALAQGIYAAVGKFGEPVGFLPRYISHDSELFQSLVGQHEMRSLGLDLAKSPFAALGDSFGTGLIYLGLVVVLGVLYLVQQRMVAARAAVSPTMSPAQQKLMQYLPVAFAVFQVFFVLGLVIYYICQAVLRIGLQHYITRAFYGHDESLGRQAQRASEHARELARQDSEANGGGGGLFAQARRDLATAKTDKAGKGAAGKGAASKGAAATEAAVAAASTPGSPRPSKRTTEPKNRPTPSGNRPSGRPQRGGRPGGPRSKSGGKRRR
jgi:YidC/Oxa1 family membrane protein insertase